ncbi:hypothetical protein ACLOJK_040470 [Asimina triloba]
MLSSNCNHVVAIAALHALALLHLLLFNGDASSMIAFGGAHAVRCCRFVDAGIDSRMSLAIIHRSRCHGLLSTADMLLLIWGFFSSSDFCSPNVVLGWAAAGDCDLGMPLFEWFRQWILDGCNRGEGTLSLSTRTLLEPLKARTPLVGFPLLLPKKKLIVADLLDDLDHPNVACRRWYLTGNGEDAAAIAQTAWRLSMAITSGGDGLRLSSSRF